MARYDSRTFVCVFALLLALLVVTVVEAQSQDQETRYLGDKFSFRVIGGLVDLNTDVAAGKGLGALIDLEDVLGFEEQMSTFGFDGFYRFTENRKHAIYIRFGNFSRDAYNIVEGSVPILDLEFTGEVESTFINQVATVDYQYSLVNNGKTEAGIQAGLAFYRYDLEVAGQVAINEDPDQTAFRSERVDVVAPVPGFGFFINQGFTKNLIFELRTSFIDLAIGEHTGRIFSSWGNLTWYFSRHFGIGIGVSGSDVGYEKSGTEKIKVDVQQSSINANLTWVF
jgi:hypothetical protein